MKKLSRALCSSVALCLFIASCAKSKDIAVCQFGSTWEQGETKPCIQEKLIGDESPVLLCNDEATAAFFMTTGALETTKDQETRSKIRKLFYDRTKTFAVTFRGKSATGKDGVPLGAWQCRKTGTGIDCSI